MKFDMSAAWNEAIRLMAANRQVVAIVAGVFFFLPAVIYGLAFTNPITEIQASQGADPEFESTMRAVTAVVNEVWWVIALTMVVQWLGMLALALLWADKSRPTVGQAIRSGAGYLLPLIGAQLIMFVFLGIVILFFVAIAATGSAGAALLGGLIAAAAIVYVFVRLSLIVPVIAIERIKNPIGALGRSWRLTKGKAFRLMAFFFLLFIAMIVINSVVTLVFGLFLALGGAEMALVGQAIGSGLVSALFSVIFLAVLIAVYRQVAGSADEVRETYS